MPTTAPPINGDVVLTTVTSADVANIAATIRKIESNNNYTAHAKKGSASGAYQFIDSTWQGLARTVPAAYNYANGSAMNAPPAVQDAVAAQYVTNILAQNGNHVAAVPVHWYSGAAWNNALLLDSVPAPQYGNTLTVRKYAERWLSTFRNIASVHVSTDVGVSFDPTIIPVIGGAIGSAGNTALGAVNAASSAFNAATSSLELFKKLLDPQFVVRVLKVVVGVSAIFVGLYALVKDTAPAQAITGATKSAASSTAKAAIA